MTRRGAWGRRNWFRHCEGGEQNREEERVRDRARKGEWEAPGSVRSQVRAKGSGLSACNPDSRTVMKEVFSAAPGEGFIGGLLPDGFEKLDCLAVAEDIVETQEYPMDAAGCRQEGRKECFVDIRGRKVLAILLHFGTSSVVPSEKRILWALEGAVSMSKQAPLLDIGHGGYNKKRGPSYRPP